MRIDAWLASTERRLADAGIATARLDSLVLLTDQLGCDKSWLLSHPEHELQRSEIQNLSTKIAQRTQHVPLAYIRGHAEFYGRDFAVNAHTLVPRPETETIIELLRGLFADNRLRADARILDVGTGSGCIAITVALELPSVHAIACDIDTQCLETAAQNARTLNANVEFIESDLLTSTPGADVVLANLPYVPDKFGINTAATHEPRRALFGGPDGLDLYRRMFEQVATQAGSALAVYPDTQVAPQTATARPRYVLTESLPPQHETLAAIANTSGYHLQQTSDLIQLFTAQK